MTHIENNNHVNPKYVIKIGHSTAQYMTISGHLLTFDLTSTYTQLKVFG